jgi:two-component system OmpR family sensor kinase
VLIPLFGTVIWLAVGRGLRPLSAMSRAVAKRRPDALAPLAERDLPAELQPLAGSLNDLLSRLDAALGAQRRFTADAAHELRTPLAALKLQLDMARRADDVPARLAAYDDLEAGVERAAHLVDQLLTLARVEPEALATRAADCDLVALAKEAIVARGALAADKRVDLGLARDAPVPVRGDPASLAILLSNLLDNALRYTPAGGKVDVAIDDDGGVAVLTVADTGPGIPAEERDRVFDRFFRGAGNRAPGSGLGLSIVKRIADAHHATITLDAPAQGSGLVVTVRFPRAGQADGA